MSLAWLAAPLIALVLVGAVLYLLKLVPIDETVKQIIRVVVIVFLVIWAILFIFGMGGANFSTPAR